MCIRDRYGVSYLDVYAPGMDQKQYDEFFDLVQKELVPIIQKISAVNYRVDRSVLNHYVAVEKQEKLMELMKSYLHFDASWGLMGVSMHPFTNGLCHGDVRVTTAYDTHDISSALFSIIHEIGHATYERNMNCLLYTSPSPRDRTRSRMPSSA